jgi:hypothetical protein
VKDERKPKSSPGLWTALTLLLVLPPLGYLSIEGIQRWRYASLQRRTEAALADFASRAEFGRDVDGRIKLAAGQVPAMGGYFFESSPGLDEDEKEYLWQLMPRSLTGQELEGPDGGDVAIFVEVRQERGWILRSPRVSLALLNLPASLRQLLKEALKAREIDVSF